MIPVALRLRNFLSYGEEVPPLDFTEFEVACLSGQNGHGKSAILDAITWALWGEGRKASGDRKAYEGLLRLGQTEMEVEFAFDLEGERYRVWRRWRKRSKGGDASLEFQVFDGEKQMYIPLTTSSIVETQRKIDQFLRMDYTTFTNSSFILQGRADEFTRQTATKRKEILFEILGLDRYEELAKKAKEHRDQAEQKRLGLQARLDVIDRELADEPAWREQGAAVESELEHLGEQMALRDVELTTLQERRAELMAKEGRVRELATGLQQVQRDQAELQSTMQQAKTELLQDGAVVDRQDQTIELHRRYQEVTKAREDWLGRLREHNTLEAQAVRLEKVIALERSRLERQQQARASHRDEFLRVIEETKRQLADEEQVKAGFAAWQEAKSAEQEWQAKWQALRTLEEQCAPLEQTLHQTERTLAMELARVEAQFQDETKRAQEEGKWSAAREQARSSLGRLTTSEAEREQVRERGTQLNNELSALVAERKRLDLNHGAAEEKLALLKQSAGASCPLCHHDLDEQEASSLERQLREEIQRDRMQMQETERAGKAIQGQITSLRERFKALDAELKQKPAADQALAQAEAGLAEALRAAERVRELQQRVSSLRKRLDDKDYAQETRATLITLNERVLALAFDTSAYHAIGQRRQQLESYLARHAALQAARSRLEQAQNELAPADQAYHALTEQLMALRYADAEHDQLVATRKQQAALGYSREQHDAIQRAWDQVQDAPTQLERLQQATARLQRNRVRLTELQERGARLHAAYVELVARRDQLQSELQSLPQILSQLAAVDAQMRSLRRTREEKMQNLGGLRTRLAACATMRTERSQLEAERRTAAQEKSLYDQLVGAFGKDGIPALIVEQAIPEIEAEANEILARLTDNATQLTIESKKETASGSRETLEIKISDELGTRDYEMYSGGEAFRCDFALRIALSKLLARRSGTRLRTLVIDEGFGTQDAEGLEHLVEAIQAVRSDFDKILVITHLDALKNAFPVRIEVTKYPEIGSRFEVVHL